MKTKLIAVFMLCASLAFGQGGYHNYDNMTRKLRDIESKNQSITVKSIGKSEGGKDIWVATLSKGAAKPAVMVVAGLDGMHQAGTQVAVMMLEKLAADNASLSKILEYNTVYIIPSANPDAIEAYFAAVKFEKSGNATKTDDDRNGRVGDDPYEDLNKDGWITQIRVENPTGNYIVSESDDRIMLMADPAKGQIGKYLVLTEGIDNDKDGQFNEDASEGVNIDKNFAFDYPFFQKSTGSYAASEKETRALIDFVVATPNIHSVLIFGPHNNLTEALKYDAKLANQRIIKSWSEKDTKTGEQIAKMYNSKTGLKNAPKLPMAKGNFAQTVYYHSGKFSYSTPGWWAPKIETPKDTTAAKPKKDDKEESPLANYLQWADSEGLNDVFVPWTDFSHPDFPGQKAQIGGLKPYAMFNPPAKYLDEIAQKHNVFLQSVVEAMPKVQIVNPLVEKLQGDVYRVTVQVVNKGLMPTYAEIADKISHTSKMKTELTLANGQSRVSGKKVDVSAVLQPNEAREMSWLISGKGKITIKSGCATAGTSEISLDLN